MKLFFSFILLVITSFQVHSKSQLDLGVGFLGLKVNHYRGSDQTKDYNFYVPYIYYKSDDVEAEGAFVDTTFVENRFLSFKFSLVVGPNVESETNRARKGMPELNYNVGIGPMVILHLIKGPKFFLEIDSSVRQEFQTNLRHTATIGNTNTTYLTTRYKDKNFTLEFGLGRMFATDEYHAYYYDVEEQYVTSQRAFYESKGGYSGDIALLSLKKKFGDFMLYGFTRYENLEGTVFEDSPLVKQTDYFFFGLGVFYLIF